MNALVWPLMVPFAAALVALLGRGNRSFRGAVAVLSGVAQVGVALWLISATMGGHRLVLPVGRWGAPYGIVLVADLFAAIMLALAAITLLAATLYGLADAEPGEEHPLRIPLLQFLALGVNLSFITGDLFNLFVAFELLLVSSYALLTIEVNDRDVKHAFPYLAMNAVGSTLFFCAAGLTYALLGTLNFADLSARAAEMAGDPRLTALALLLVGVFGLKAGLFPLYYWLPLSYPTLATPVGALFAGLLTKVGIYVLIRLCATVLPHELTFVHGVIAWLSGLTMVLGVIGAVSQNGVRSILSFHILSQVAFMTLALGFFTPLSVAAAIFYIAHHILVKGSLFLVGGLAARRNGSDNLDRMGGLWKAAPWLGLLFLAQALSLAGLPPLSGFWGKYLILVEGISLREYVLVGASLVASALTLFSMLKIWLAAFWRETPGVPVDAHGSGGWVRPAVIGGMVMLSLGIGLGAGPMLALARDAAGAVLDQPGYRSAVFEARGKEAGS